MLDLNYVRGNLERVRAALEARGAQTSVLDSFEQLDNSRREIISQSDKLNAERNASSREIGALMKEGKQVEANARRQAVSSLKDHIAALDNARDDVEKQMHDLLSTIPNIPHESAPVGADESANVEVRQW